MNIIICLNPRECVLLCSAVCSALTELVVNDTNGQQIVQVSGLLFCFCRWLCPQHCMTYCNAVTFCSYVYQCANRLQYLI